MGRFERARGERRYRRLFLIATEGVKTEPEYFRRVESLTQERVVKIRCVGHGHESSPPQILKKMNKALGMDSLKNGDDAWLVVDKDHWTDAQLTLLHVWARAKANRGLAVSNPKFEYWLLLHFEDGTGEACSGDCSARLTRHLPGYDKGLTGWSLDEATVQLAIDRARRRDNPPCSDWPRNTGVTTVYRLVEKILSSS